MKITKKDGSVVFIPGQEIAYITLEDNAEVVENSKEVCMCDDSVVNAEETIFEFVYFRDMTAVITGVKDKEITEVKIPSQVQFNGEIYSVTRITKAFMNCASLTSIVIPNTVTSIGDMAFCGCKSLTSIEIPNSVTTIKGMAFKDCTRLTSIEIPNSVTSIGGGAFQNCTSLTSIEIPNSVTEIEMETFRNCTSLTSVVIGNSVTKIGQYAFTNCKSLTSVIIPRSVTEIANWAFSNCTNLKTAQVPNGCKFDSDVRNTPFPVTCKIVYY